MNRFSRPSVSILTAALVLAGCSSNSSLLESKRIDYKSAKPSTTLEIPPDLTAPRRDDRFAVPRSSATTYSDYNAVRSAQPASGSTGVLTSSENMRIERAGNQRWLVVRSTAEQVWPQLRDFWLELGFVLNIDNPSIGVLETDWRENRANIKEGGLRKLLGLVIDGLYSTPERDKFRARIERGVDGETVEIYVSHRGMVEIYPNEAKDATIWQARPADPELETEMLRRLMIHLGADEARAQATVASATPQADRAKVEVIDGETRLQVDEPFDHAWRRVGLALDRISFTVEDRDRANGLYFVRYVDPEADVKKKGGFFSWLAFWRSSDDKKNEGEYRLQIEGRGGWSAVTVQTREGGVDSSPTAQRILALLQQELR
jgi:outer membrane protein assembly factor BamC